MFRLPGLWQVFSTVLCFAEIVKKMASSLTYVAVYLLVEHPYVFTDTYIYMYTQCCCLPYFMRPNNEEQVRKQVDTE